MEDIFHFFQDKENISVIPPERTRKILEDLCDAQFPLRTRIQQDKVFSSLFTKCFWDHGYFIVKGLFPSSGNLEVKNAKGDIELATKKDDGIYMFKTRFQGFEKYEGAYVIKLSCPTQMLKFERRKFPRIYFEKEFGVILKMKLPASNISEGGLGVEVQEGTVVEVEIEAEGKSARSIGLITHIGGAKKKTFGIKFTDISLKDRETLGTFLVKKQREKIRRSREGA